MKTEIILKSDSFSYPTKDERKEIEKRIPKINRLDFKYTSAFIDFLAFAGVLHLQISLVIKPLHEYK